MKVLEKRPHFRCLISKIEIKGQSLISYNMCSELFIVSHTHSTAVTQYIHLSLNNMLPNSFM